jgi:hypothetical protein
MKKLILSASLLMLVFSCGENETSDFSESQTTVTAHRGCASHDVLLNKLNDDPKLAERMNEIESFTQNAIKEGRLVNGVIEIPVVVNVLYKTNSQNISLAQIQSQIDVLNEDFNGTNSEYNSIPSLFSGVKANVGVSFVLDAVNRKSTKKKSWRTDDSMKKSNRGGIAPTSPTTKLNLWVCNMSGGILGYAQFPGGSSATDGVVIDDNAMGTSGSASAPFDLGRTATHEVGHWMNLRHIWGDATCGNDFVNDTPSHNTANYGCPSFPHYSTCSGTPVEMTMNYMDYTNDACMYMFSSDQKSRMLALFSSGGARNTFAQP